MCFFDHFFAHNFFAFCFLVKPIWCSFELFKNPVSTIISRGEKFFFRGIGNGDPIFSGLVPKHCWPRCNLCEYAIILPLLRIVEDSRAIVTPSQKKAVELGLRWRLISTSNCFSSCFLHAPVGDPFYERCNPFNNMDLLSESDVIQTESPENFVVIFEILPIDKEWKSDEITSCRSWASCQWL